MIALVTPPTEKLFYPGARREIPTQRIYARSCQNEGETAAAIHENPRANRRRNLWTRSRESDVSLFRKGTEPRKGYTRSNRIS